MQDFPVFLRVLSLQAEEPFHQIGVRRFRQDVSVLQRTRRAMALDLSIWLRLLFLSTKSTTREARSLKHEHAASREPW